MIFRIKLHWWLSLPAGAVLLLTAWSLGGLDHHSGRLRSVEEAAAVGVAAAAVVLSLNFLIDRALRWRYRDRYRDAFRVYALDVAQRMRPLDAVAGGLMAGLGEEPFFRGVIVPYFESPMVGVVVAALIFGTAHYLNRKYWGFFLWGIGEGLLFGALFVATRSIIVPALAHGIFDTVGFFYFLRVRRLHEAGAPPQAADP